MEDPGERILKQAKGHVKVTEFKVPEQGPLDDKRAIFQDVKRLFLEQGLYSKPLFVVLKAIYRF